MKRKSLPADPERFARWQKRITEPEGTGHRLVNSIPVLLVHNVWPLLRAYYGSYPKALWACASFQAGLWLHGQWITLLMRISDQIGWTVCHESGIRHGASCSPNCESIECIEKAQPAWFRRLTQIGM